MLVRLAAGLRSSFDQSVLCLLDKGPLAQSLESIGISVECLHASSAVPDPLLPLRVARVVKRFKPDIVQTWLYQSDLVGGLGARLARSPRVVWNLRAADDSGNSSHPLTRAVIRICAKLSRTLPDRIVCCAASAAHYHASIGYASDRMDVIPNGVDTERFVPDPTVRESVRSELRVGSCTPLVGMFARLHPQKDHGTFFSAAAMTSLKRPDVHYVLAGQRIRPDEPALRNWIDRYGLAGKVHLLGERRDVPRLTAALDVATSVSCWGEGFPNVLCEAMSCGIPCVTTDSGDARAIIGTFGMVVPKGDSQAVSAAWLQMLALPDSARSEIASLSRRHVVSQFDQRSSIERYSALYHSLAPT